MKILRIIARLNVGGPARHVVWLSSALNEGEYETRLIAGTVPPGEENMEYFAREHGVAPLFLKEMSRELSLKDVISFIKAFREMRNFSPDVVHTHTAKAGTIGRAAAFAYKWFTWGTLIGMPRPVRIVHTFHGHVFHSYYGRLKTRVFITIEKFLARFATDKIVVITGQQFEEIHKKFGVGRADQFVVIPLGIDTAEIRNAGPSRNRIRAELGLTGTTIAVGLVGRLTEIKDVSLFIEAAGRYIRLFGDEGTRLRFFIVGDGNLRNRLETEAAERGAGDIISFLGNRDDVAEIYSALDIVALTSLNEGTPLSVIEGMAAGRPVVSSMAGGVVDLLGKIEIEKDGFVICERGIGIPGRSDEDLLKGLIYLAKDEQLRGRLEESGKAFVNENYSKERLIDDIKELYQDLAGKNSG
jgi:glycosyltransferase involved in cell wall biosynthesis